VVRKAVQLARDYAKPTRPMIKPTRPRKECRWLAPPPSWIKVNVDGAYSSGDYQMGAGAVLRSADGALLQVAWEPTPRNSVLLAESRALQLGLTLARGQGLVEVETDSLELV
jgi:hypothetical protein